MKSICLCIAIIASFCGVGWGSEVLIANIVHGEVPTIEKDFDRLLRENLAGTPHVVLIDPEAAQRVARSIDFSRFTALSRGLVEQLKLYVSDSTIIVWGRVRDYSFRTTRVALLGAAVEADLKLTLNMYSLSFRSFAYVGDIVAHAKVSKGWIGFSPVDKIVHVTAEDRRRLNADLVDQSALQCSRQIASVILAEKLKVQADEAARKYEEPTVLPVFEHESISAKLIPGADKQLAPVDSTAADSTAEPDTTTSLSPKQAK